jgi:hypothetical protein
MSRTHAEHLDWVKTRAFEYLDAGDLASAVSSAVSDLCKHEDWKGVGSGKPGSREWMAEGLRAVTKGKLAVIEWLGRIS